MPSAAAIDSGNGMSKAVGITRATRYETERVRKCIAEVNDVLARTQRVITESCELLRMLEQQRQTAWLNGEPLEPPVRWDEAQRPTPFSVRWL
jgi:hypothetical protein